MNPSNKQLDQVRSLWKLEQKDIRFVRHVENFVYEAELAGRPVILRLTEPVHRSKDQIESELNWMNFLTQEGMRLASPIRSSLGTFVEKLEGGQIFFVSVFKKALGTPIKQPREFDTTIMQKWGRYVGKMQCLTRNYFPNANIPRRPDWNKDTLFQVVLRGLDECDKIPFQRFHQLMEWLKTLPRDESSYGLVHCDLHYGNFFVNNGEITAFDFDDCCYHWFIYDLVTPLFHIWQKRDQGELTLPYKALEEAYLSGYLAEYSLDKIWLDRIELFTMFRISTVYHWAKACMAEGRFSENEDARKWCEKLFVWGKNQLHAELKFC